MKKRIIIFLGIVLVLILVKYIIAPKINFIDENGSTNNSDFTDKYLDKEKICLEFIKENMTSESGGIYTNYLEKNKMSEMASGHEILSESEGLIMLYYAKAKKKNEFDKHFNIVKSKMLDESGLIKWRIKEDNYNLAMSSASIDDLRIIRGLMHAYDIWGDKEYYDTLEQISSSVLKYNIYEGCLNNYYDMKYKYKSKEIDVSYIDLYTMKLLSKINNKWIDIYDRGLNVIQDGYISNKIPLYRKTYDIEKEKYIDSETINSIDALLVVLHLSEVRLEKKESIEWIREQMKDGKGIYANYNVETGKPMNKVESTATYAIAARIARNIGDTSLYKALIDRMLELQVTDTHSPLYGGFGDINSLEVYSFDNLQALLAFRF